MTAATPPEPRPTARHRRVVAAAAAAALVALAACSGSGGGDEVGTGGEAQESESAGAGAGQLVGGLTGEEDETTTTTGEAPPETETTETTVAPTTRPPTTAPPQTSPPRTNPPVTAAPPQTAAPRPQPSVVGAPSGDRGAVYHGLMGGMPIARSLNDSAQTWANQMAAANNANGSSNPWLEAGGTSSPWSNVSEITAFAPDVQTAIQTLQQQAGAFAGMSHCGIGVASANGNVYVSVRVGR